MQRTLTGQPTELQQAIDQVIRGRRSVRSLLPDRIAEADLRAILEAACWAPSPHNAQPWRFAAVVSETEKRRLADAMEERWTADLAADGPAPDLVLTRVGRRRERILAAPAAVVACLVTEGLHVYPDARRQHAERATAVQSLGAAIQNLLLSAHARGLGACWMCAPVFCPEVARAALDLDAGWEPQALILLGYPARSPAPRPRRGVGELVVFR